MTWERKRLFLAKQQKPSLCCTVVYSCAWNSFAETSAASCLSSKAYSKRKRRQGRVNRHLSFSLCLLLLLHSTCLNTVCRLKGFINLYQLTIGVSKDPLSRIPARFRVSTYLPIEKRSLLQLKQYDLDFEVSSLALTWFQVDHNDSLIHDVFSLLLFSIVL